MTPDAWWNPARMDLFQFWRFVLSGACTIYAAVVMLQSLWRWALYLSGGERATTVLRHYVIVQLLRLRVRRFSGELVQIAIWSGVFLVLIRMHSWI